MASETRSVLADGDYFKSEEILACHDANIIPYVPKPMTSAAKADGRFNIELPWLAWRQTQSPAASQINDADNRRLACR